MEEKKKSSKEIKMNPTTGNNGQEKLSYDDLNAFCQELTQQNQQLVNYVKQLQKQVREINMSNAFRRLDYLFSVVHYANQFNPEFVGNCVEEIQKSLTIPEPAPATTDATVSQEKAKEKAN